VECTEEWGLERTSSVIVLVIRIVENDRRR